MGQLLQNAARYRGPEPVVTISARPLGRQVQLTVADNGLTKTALLIVGNCLGEGYERSRLYDPSFTTGFREGQP